MPRSRVQAPGAVDRLLALPAVDRALAGLLAHPRMLQAISVAIGVLMVALAFRPLIAPSLRPGVPAPPPIARSIDSPTAVLAAETTASDEDVVLGLVMAYNQASITAAVMGTLDPMAPYLTPDGTAWAAVQAEYQRRTTRGETHDPTLTRWGVLRLAVDGATATVETLEQWDDITRVGGAVVSSKRGILTRNTYDLRRSPGMSDWRITTVSSTTITG